jgi:hydroxyacylglutathione hydrolase
MILKRFYDEKLAQASYLIGCAATGDALVVDPHRDVQQFIDAAEAEGLRITHVTETHIHADFVSGLRELAERAGARAYVSDEGGPDWTYAFAADIGATLLKDGASFSVGNIRIDALHTPGHTPEHMCFVVTDTAGADEPMGVITGDFVFVGDVGRPDLLEKAAGVSGTMEAGARELFRSLQRFRELPDWLQLWPGHGAGSACGKALGAVPSTTLGYEKRFNWAFSYEDEESFVEAVLAGQPEPPKYFAEMKRINREGPRVLGGFPRPPRRDAAALASALRAGATVVDMRDWDEYRRAHVPGTLSIPLNRSFTTWAGWLVPYEQDFYLVAEREQDVAEAVRDLAMIGLDRVSGWFDAGVTGGAAGDGAHRIAETSPAELRAAIADGAVTVLDVRGQAEYDAGHLAGVQHIPLGYLRDRVAELPRDRPVVVHCKAGGRSAIAASVLAAHGFEGVINMDGGYDRWVAAGLPTQTGTSQ